VFEDRADAVRLGAVPPMTVVPPTARSKGAGGTPLAEDPARLERARRQEVAASCVRVVAFGVDVAAMLAAAAIAGLPWHQAGIGALLGAGLLLAVGLHRGRLGLGVADDLADISVRVGGATLLVWLIFGGASASVLVATILWSAALVIGGRAVLYAGVRTARRRRWLQQDALIVGAGPIGVAIAKALEEHPEYGLRPVGFVDRFQDQLALPMAGTTDDLPDIVARTGIRHIFLAFGHAREAEMVPLVRRCTALPVELYSLPRFFELGHAADARATDDLWGFPIIRLRTGGCGSKARRRKRVFDLVTASLLLVPALPVLALCALAVKLTSPGPVLFRQTRVGQHGHPFELVKFRSMTVNADSDVTWTVDNDTRVTAVGRFLRPTHLDELPQLWNIFRGDMSIVGPRPERPVFVDQFGAEIRDYHERHRLPVGLTGWAQVHGLWGDTSIHDRVRLDNRYIERWTLWNDLLILFRTLPTLLGRRAS
jgi:exopolysaccharide biosynthesis polyprenyl glycosylphosphotransferase